MHMARLLTLLPLTLVVLLVAGEEEKSCGAAPFRFFIARHGERLDHVHPEWAANSARPHDGPLSPKGHQQALALGKYLKTVVPGPLTRALSSPLVRTTQTLSRILEGMGLRDSAICYEPCFSENDRALRERMLRTHRKSVPGPSVVTVPVTLSTGDFVAFHENIDHDYIATGNVGYDS
eukprot:Sspe_Gene.117997::Locus_110443_Transcript_1_3_Confidence_0.500_Length_572::g.117997::m.117997